MRTIIIRLRALHSRACPSVKTFKRADITLKHVIAGALMMSVEYEKMLKRARAQLPPEVFERKRFELPKPHGSTIGMRTILHNYKEICDVLNRDPHHLLKFLSREMATAGTIDATRAIFQGKFRRDTLEHLIRRYVDYFVTCPICKRPDTKIAKEKRLSFLICEACGARSPTRPV